MAATSSQFHISATLDDLRNNAAAYVARTAAQAIAQRGAFTVAFSGGSLPGLVAPPLIALPLLHEIDWSAWRIFFADERCVPLDDPESNYCLLRESLLKHAPIPATHVFTINAELSPEKIASAYSVRLQRVLERTHDGWPIFDLILLGLGPDGHTASLFPGHPLLDEERRWVASIVDAPKPPPQRITLTLPVINRARCVAFIAAGANKAAVMARALGPQSKAIPASLVRPITGELRWFVDRAAAQQIADADG